MYWLEGGLLVEKRRWWKISGQGTEVDAGLAFASHMH